MNESFDEYIEYLEEDGTWAGNLELQALSKIIKKNIIIHILNQKPWTMINYSKKSECI